MSDSHNGASVTCHYCRMPGDLRPYGPRGEPICFECAMSPERKATTQRMFAAQLDAAGNAVMLTEHGPVPMAGGAQ